MAPSSASPVDPARAPPREPGRLPSYRQLRLTLYLAFGALALALAAQAWSSRQLDQARAADSAILAASDLQSAAVQGLGRLAALVAGDPASRPRWRAELDALLARAQGDAAAQDARLERELAQAPDLARAAGSAAGAWRAERTALWAAGAALSQGEADAADLGPRNAAVQDRIAPALAAAQRLRTVLHAAVEARVGRVHNRVRWGLIGMAALLLGLGLALIEPTARSLRRHSVRLDAQAAELRRLAMVAEHTAALVLISDAADLVLWVNEAFEQRTGWPLHEAWGRRPGELLAHPHADDTVLGRVQQALRQGQGTRQEWLHRTRGGADLWLDVDLRPLHGEQGQIEGFVRVCTDVTARAMQQAKLQALWAALPAGVVVHAPGGEIVDSNRTAERLLGLRQSQLAGIEPVDAQWQALRCDGSAYPLEEQPAQRTLASGVALHNETMGVRSADGELRWLMVNTEPQRDPLGQISGVVACFLDITESRALQDRLSDSARTDELTRLPNRIVVMERLEHAIEHAARHPGYGFAVLFMDFDRFKDVNDTLGHGAGDELLRQIAARLQRTVRPGDAVARVESASDGPAPIAARLGGDEFVVVLEGVHDAATVGVIAERLLRELSEPYLVGCQPVQSSASIGVVLCNGGTAAESAGDAAEAVLRNADTAMYEAKRAGRGRWVLFDDSMHERVVRTLALEADLRRALKEDELFVVYQPVIDLETRALVGVEALVRWLHPVRGLVGPVEFIGVAEECGLIDALGAFVLERACRQFVDWRRRLGGAAPRLLAVNLSRAQLNRAGLADEVGALLRDCGMSPPQLQLEVTESLAAQEERVQATLRELKSLGVQLALDDFGTGYSSLACLHQMPVDTVKIDRSFVQHAENVEYHRVLIEATIRVAR
ncbi:MAG: EAL domain-containing protein, partial [Burkholderiales bacterium]|nr:EAL domain-containing protein [Burkholderiales bacterium]